MSSAWLAYVLIVGSLVAACVAAADVACQAVSLPRRWSWGVGVAAVVALTFASARAPGRSAILPETTAQEVAAIYGQNSNSIASYTAQMPAIVENTKGDLGEAVIRTAMLILPDRLERWHAVVWAAASCGLALLILLVHTRYLRARKRWPAAEMHGVRVRVAPRAGPAVVGAFAPDIVVPQWLFKRPRDEQLLVLRHELEHVKARDPLLLASAWSAAVLLPWHPALWWMLARLRLAVELDCDRRLVTRGDAEPKRYGALLLELTQQSAGLPISATSLAGRSAQLERRLIAMNSERSTSPRQRGLAFAALAVALIATACAVRVPIASDDGEPTIPIRAATTAAPRSDSSLAAPPAASKAQSARTTPPAEPAKLQSPKVAPPLAVTLKQPLSAHSAPKMKVALARGLSAPPLAKQPPLEQGATRVVMMTKSPPMKVVAPVVLTTKSPSMKAPAATSVAQPPLPTGGTVAPTRVAQPPAQRDTAQRSTPPVVRGAAAAALYDQRALSPAVQDLRDAATPQNTIYYIDGVMVSYAQGVAMPAILISSVQVTQPTSANSPTIVRITSIMASARGSASAVDTASARSDTTQSVRQLPQQSGSLQPLIVLDGVLMPPGFDAGSVEHGRIDRVDVVRGRAAVSLYGERAANGVISIVLKKN
jgi:beta-lactamase regulating signal transducer with metallopeptidase domain